MLEISEVYATQDNNDTQWIEIFNPNEVEVDLNNYYIKSLNIINLIEKNISGGFSNCKDLSKLASKAYCVYYFNEKILETDDTVTLLDIYDNENYSLSYSNSQNYKSFSNFQNNWTDLLTPTPGKENILKDTLQITELFPSPNSSKGESEWIEIYNYGDETINLSQWYFKDGGANLDGYGNSKSILPDMQINAGEHLVIENLSISLNNSGDTIGLFTPFDQLNDQVTYSESEYNHSNARKFIVENSKYSQDIELILTEIVTAGRINEFPLPKYLSLISIQDAKSKNLESEVVVQGNILVEKDVLGSNIFYIQDESGGIKIYLDSDFAFNIARNQIVRVVGILKESRSEKYIKVYNSENIYTSIDNKLLGSQKESYINNPSTTNWEVLEGNIVSLEGEIVNNYSTSFDMQSSNGIVRVSILSATNIDIEKSKGDYIIVKGIVSQYDDLYRLLPRYNSDVIVKKQSLLSTAATKSSKKTPSPKNKTASVKGVETSAELSIIPKTVYEKPFEGIIEINESELEEGININQNRNLTLLIFLIGFLASAIYLIYLSQPYWKDIDIKKKLNNLFKDNEDEYFNEIKL